MNKKFIAILTALALVVTLVAPVGVQEASAATKNKVDRVPTVTANYELNKLGPNMPNLLVEVDDTDPTVGGTTYKAWQGQETFRVQLPDTAEWVKVPAATGNIADVRKVTDQIIEVTTVANLGKSDIITIPLDVKIKSGATGEQKLTINNMDSRVTGGSYTFAIVQTGDTVVTLGSKKTVKRGASSDNDAAEIIIDETTVGALAGQQKFTVKLSSGVEWTSDTTVTWDNTPITENNSKTNGFEINGRDLTVYFQASDSASYRRSLVIKPVLNVTRDAKYGDITASISSSSSSDIRDAAGNVITKAKGSVSTVSNLLIAEYKDFGVEVTVEEVKEFLAGYHTDDYKTAKITIKETIENSLVDGRVIEFELPSWVKLRDTLGTTHEVLEPTVTDNGVVELNSFEANSNGIEFEYTVKRNNTSGKAEIDIEIPIVIEGTATGDITLNVKGAGIESQELVIGKAVAPVTAEVKMADVRLGVQAQEAPEIIIEETVAGAIRDKAYIDLKFVDSVGFRFDGAKFEVIEGDIEIDVDKSGRKDENRALEIYVKSDSSKPSKIRVYDIKLTVDRTAPEGPIKLDLAGSALVNYPLTSNNATSAALRDASDYYKDFAKRIARFDFANVITPAPGETRGTAVFTIDSNTYTVIENGVEVERTMDVAPYIKDSRTFLPVFFVAQALGVSEQNVVWEPHTKTVTIYKGDRIAQMQIGSKQLIVNGITVTMDTAPEIKDGRTMLPIYYVGQALGASVEWDGEARTVTVRQ